ncbi:MAG TPA: hypothetical protein VKP65_08830 [Rhodothermales bacterium]|nr:hypothetical protein [Rhodothermales bacterium]
MKQLIRSFLTTSLVLILFAGCGTVDSNGPEMADVDDQALSASKKSGSSKYDQDNNGSPDAGIYVNGHYTSLYAYDMAGDWYWDLGDGRIQGTVGSVEDLDETTLTTCDYVNNYRADFGNDPFMDAGWIQNHINCQGYDDNGQYNYLMVHESDPRYTGNPDWEIWGTWEYHVLTISGEGNWVAKSSNPQTNVNN